MSERGGQKRSSRLAAKQPDNSDAAADDKNGAPASRTRKADTRGGSSTTQQSSKPAATRLAGPKRGELAAKRVLFFEKPSMPKDEGLPKSSRHRPRLAIVLHGRLGGLASLLGAPPRALRSFDGAIASVSAAALCATALERHFIAPNRAHAEMDVFGHSWSPEIGETLDTLFSPRRSSHEHGLPLAGFRCPHPSFSLNYCHRTVSHLLGISRAMALKRAEEQARSARNGVPFVRRHRARTNSRPAARAHSPPHGLRGAGV